MQLYATLIFLHICKFAHTNTYTLLLPPNQGTLRKYIFYILLYISIQYIENIYI